MTRVRAFDWLRGIAVLVMIQTHALVLLEPGLRAGPFWTRLQWVDGLVAPAFLFSAGFSLALVQVRGAAAGMRAARVRKTLRRLGEVLLVATLVNWMWFPIFREPRWILRIDILQCIGLSLVLALPILAFLSPRPRVLAWVALGLAAAVFGISPLAEHVRGPFAGLANGSNDSVFPLLPWAGYVYLGASAGAVAAHDARKLPGWIAGLLVLGGALWTATPLLRDAYPPHQFWVTNPANHASRWTEVCALLLVLLALERVPAAAGAISKTWLVELFGTSSLAGYFFHQVLLFFRIRGFCFEAVWGNSCGWPKYWVLVALLVLATAALTFAMDRLYATYLRFIEPGQPVRVALRGPAPRHAP